MHQQRLIRPAIKPDSFWITPIVFTNPAGWDCGRRQGQSAAPEVPPVVYDPFLRLCVWKLVLTIVGDDCNHRFSDR